MVKKNRVQSNTDVNRWLISYADFITLMFAFFVVMFAAAYDSDDSRAQHLAKAVSTAFTLNVFQHGGTQVFGKKMYAMNEGAVLDSVASEALSMSEKRGEVEKQKDLSTNDAEKFEPISAMRDQLTQEFYKELKKSNITATLESRGLVVSFSGAAYFDEGSEVIRPESMPLIDKVMRAIQGRRNFIQVEGHADGSGRDQDVQGSNMALSLRRAQAVAMLLVKKYGVSEEYISTTGYGPFRAVNDNRLSSGRAQNRRVDIVLLKTVPDERQLAIPTVDGNAMENAVAIDSFKEEGDVE